jgi:hypothetical protein
MYQLSISRVALPLVVALGCSAGAQTPVTTSDAGIVIDRNKLYCRTATMARDTSVLGVATTCDKDGDIPLNGSCEAPQGYGIVGSEPLTLLTNRPGNWEVKATNGPGPAGWSCAWAIGTGGATNVPEATATICCLAQ